jgi:hypothetical protein
MDIGNAYLRSLSPFRVRSLLKLEMMHDEKAKDAYRQYDTDRREIEATYSASYRGVEKGGVARRSTD